MDKLECLVGIDWGTVIHLACVTDAAGHVLAERDFGHGGAGLAEMADWIAATARAGPQSVGIAIETPHGPVVEAMMERGFAVHSINPRQLDRFRDRFSPAGAKDDSRDARVLADALRTDPHAFRHLDPVLPEIVELREWSRIAGELTAERVALTNRARQQLWRYYPQLLDVEGDLARAWIREVWKRAPTPEKARRVRAGTVAGILKSHRVRRIDAETVLDRLRQPAIEVAAGTANAAVAHVEVVFSQLDLVDRQLGRACREIDRLTTALGRPDTCPDEDAGQRLQRDVEILNSLPGVGRVVLATLLAEAFDPLQRRDYHALRCLSGVAPVTKRSGKTVLVLRRMAASKRLRDAVHHWARVAVIHDPICKARYAALRARGHGHARSLRTIGDRLLKVACKMLENRTTFLAGHQGQGQRHAA